MKTGCFDGNRVPTPADQARWPEFVSIVKSDEVDYPKVLVLISMKHSSLQKPEKVTQMVDDMYAVRTRLGHVLYGGENVQEGAGEVFFVNDRLLGERLEEYFERDQIATGQLYESKRMPSQEERMAMAKIEGSIQVVDGVYQVAVPWKDDDPRMPDNYKEAKQVVEGQRRSFKKKPEEFSQYNGVIQKYIRDGHAERVPDDELETETGKSHYLIHHAVSHPRKETKRVVYNASKKFRGRSVNDMILHCPDTLERLVGILLRFRERMVGVSADIKAFFHSVMIPKEDRDFGRFIWFENGSVHDDLAVFRLRKHLFGGVASQACAITALNHAIRKQFPHVWSEQFCQYIIQSFYSDDYLRSFENDSGAVEIVREICRILKENGFDLVKFRSNSERVEKALQTEETEDQSHEVSALGVVWNVKADELLIRVPKGKKPFQRTKRGILSFVMSLYDPMGFMSPFILPLKILLQKLVIANCDWDDELADEYATELEKCLLNIDQVESIRIQRCYTTAELKEVVNRSIHVFSDGSNVAYGACVYLRSEDIEGKVETQLMFGKSRVCPAKKTITVPRVKLCAAVLGTRISDFVKEETSLEIHSHHYWTDSTSTLKYIKSQCRRFQMYVANRVSEIQSRTELKIWEYVNTKENPADLACRPTLIKSKAGYRAVGVDHRSSFTGIPGPPGGEVKCEPMDDKRVQMWLHGPEFLKGKPTEWLSAVRIGEVCLDDLELRAMSFATQAADVDSPVSRLIVKCPNSFIMKTRVANLMLFCRYLKARLHREGGASKSLTEIEKEFRHRPDCRDLAQAERLIVRYVQRQEFADEIKALLKQKPIPKSSRLRKKLPILDSEGMLRLDTRLVNGYLPYEFRYPSVLPKKHHVTHLFIHEAHVLEGHQGKDAVLTRLSQRFWVLGVGETVKGVLNKCLPCKRYHARVGEQIMAALPEERIITGKPFFDNTSVDLFGHFLVKRGRGTEKRYIALFCCMSTRAVHLESIHTLEMDSFLNAFVRFSRRRGEVSKMWSDNATNFRAAEKELRMIFDDWNKQGLEMRLRQKGADWTFLPSRASHMGGVHERLIRSARSCLRHVLDRRIMTDESFETFIVECEAVLNSRPLTKFSHDPKDLRPLRPIDLLSPEPGKGLPLGEYAPGELLRKRYQRVQQAACEFWRRFRREYLSLLSLRSKWLTRRRDIAENDLVVIAEPNLHRSDWLMGRVAEVYSGRDGHVRSCLVRTSASSLVRPVAKLCLLEGDVKEPSQ